ncbi:MAG TPA: hypothetical protein VFB71_02930 [Ramlibacter sp.]|nr:hypothetical protein [Ramlibacter sp.]
MTDTGEPLKLTDEERARLLQLEKQRDKERAEHEWRKQLLRDSQPWRDRRDRGRR